MIPLFRDLPISVVIAMLLCTCVYVMTNVAYLSSMTPGDILNADAVALSFMESSFGKYAAVFITVAVVLSCMGTVNGSFLSDSRYWYIEDNVWAAVMRCFCPEKSAIFVSMDGVSK